MAKDRDNCLFCRIADHTVNSQLLYEDDLAAAFLDINPRAPQHVLIIPKKHIPRLLLYLPGLYMIVPVWQTDILPESFYCLC